MIIALDWDKTLSTTRLQQLVKKLVREGNEIWIVTARRDNEFSNKEIEAVINKLGLSRHRIIYCDEKPKWKHLQIINADIYIDDMSDEFETILNHTNTIPLLYAAH